MCGLAGKVINKVTGGLLGGSQDVSVPKTEPVTTQQDVTDSGNLTGDEEATKKAKRKRGFSSTQLRDWRSNMNTALGSGNSDGGKSTLG